MLLEILISAFILIGAAFALVGSIGLARLPDFYMRLHGPTKATTLGIGSLVIASFLYFSDGWDSISLHEILVTAFLFITAPISASMASRAALHLRLRSIAPEPEAPVPAGTGNDTPGVTERPD